MGFRRTWRWVWAAGFCLALSGCGGGDSASASSPVSSVDLVSYEGDIPPRVDVPVKLEDGSGTVYASVRVEGSSAVVATFQVTGDKTGTIRVAGASNAQPAGTYAGNVVLILCEDSGCAKVAGSKAFPFQWVVQPGLAVERAEVKLTAPEGGYAMASIGVKVPAIAGVLSTETRDAAGGSATWLSVAPAGPGHYDIKVDAAGLPAGGRTGSVVFSYVRTDGGARMTRTVAVAVTVGTGLVQPAPVTVSLDATTLPQALAGTVPVAHAAGATVAFTASADAPWLVLGAAGGTTPGSISYTIDGAAVASLPATTVPKANITIAAAGLTSMVVPVTVNVALPRIRGALPYGIVSGRPSRVVLGGSGFSKLADAASAIRVDGATPTDLRVVSDSMIEFTFPASSAGRYPVRVGNAAGITTPSSDVVVFDAFDHVAAAVPQAGDKRSLIYDPVRRAVYAVGWVNEELVRYRLVGASWQVDVKPIGDIGDIALSPDGRKLLVSTTTQSMHVLDPDTLALLRTRTDPQLSGGLSVSRTNGIAVTADGRAWVDELSKYFRIDDEVFDRAGCGGFCGLDQMYASRSGDRLVLSPGSRVSPAPPMQTWALATGVREINRSIPLVYGELSMSDDGSGILRDNLTLYDAAWQVRGRAEFPVTGEAAGTSILSRDGKRVYRLVRKSSNNAHLRVDVFDTELLDAGTSRFTRVGSIPLSAQANQCSASGSAGSGYCDILGRLTLSQDDRTLFWVANANLVVIPVPANLRPLAAQPTNRLAAQSWRR
jgi:hypothetical protein